MAFRFLLYIAILDEICSFVIKYTYDVNGRNTGKEIYSGEDKIAAEYVSYRKVGDHATNMPSTVWFAGGTDVKDSIKYKYDNCGNICEVKENGHIVAKYKYDSLNRLIREDNKVLNKTVLYTYDNCGNITERCEYAYTTKDGEELSELQCVHHSYEYDGDKLLSYDGEACEYVGDGLGYNSISVPEVYRGKNLKWLYGKFLTEYDGNKFVYDSKGRRINKNGVQHIYDEAGNLICMFGQLQFIYDNAGVIGLVHNDTQYFYRKDVQGNIIAILDNTGAVVVKYVYDAWGNHAVLDANGNDIDDAEHIGNLNPFRYRGYYYDVETGLYFLQTRYYDPETGRFISQDSLEYADPETVNGLNLYAYCGNNPVMNVDPSGTSLLAFLFAALIGFAVSFAASAVSQAIFNDGQVNWGIAAIDGLFGAISGVLWMVPGLGPVATGLINAGLTAVNGIITTGMENNWQFTTTDWISIAASSIVAGVVSGITRYQFFKANGQEVLTKSHEFVGNISRNIVNGKYNNSNAVFSRSLKSAAGQMFKNLINTNFGEGFYKDWLMTVLQSIFSITFSKGIRKIKW